MRLPVYLFEPSVQLHDGAFSERDNSLLASLSMQMYGVCAIDEDVGDTQEDYLGNARTGVIHYSKQGGISLSAPGGPVGCIEQSLNLLAGEKTQYRSIEAFATDREHALARRAGMRDRALMRSA